MLCDNCKHNEATVLIKEIRNGKSTSINLCAECARLKEQQGELGALGFNLAEVLFDLGKLTRVLKPGARKTEVEVPSEVAEAVCPKCGWSAESLRRHGGQLVCPECYRTFAPLVAGAAARIQRGPVHLGKRPAGNGAAGAVALRLELERLQRELKDLIRREEYEAAAVARDRIAALVADNFASQVLIAESIIVGEVPQSYVNVPEMDDSLNFAIP